MTQKITIEIVGADLCGAGGMAEALQAILQELDRLDRSLLPSHFDDQAVISDGSITNAYRITFGNSEQSPESLVHDPYAEMDVSESDFKLFPLDFLRAKRHPEAPKSNFHLMCSWVRTNRLKAVISDQGQVLRFAIHTLPDSIPGHRVTKLGKPFNMQCLNRKWFDALDSIDAFPAEIHGRVAFWLVHPRLQMFLDIPSSGYEVDND